MAVHISKKSKNRKTCFFRAISLKINSPTVGVEGKGRASRYGLKLSLINLCQNDNFDENMDISFRAISDQRKNYVPERQLKFQSFPSSHWPNVENGQFYAQPDDVIIDAEQ